MPKKIESEQQIKESCNRIVNVLREIREMKKINTYKLAELTGIRQPNITRMETFVNVPNLETIIKICDALDVEIVLKPKQQNAI